jgi:AcrR family transcriptional regulator
LAKEVDMPPTAAATRSHNDGRRLEILWAAAQTMIDRGYGDTRIAEVAQRADVSTALLFYYFGSREQMLLESLKLCDSSFYVEAEAKMRGATRAVDRLSLLVAFSCAEDTNGKTLRGLWFELWAQAQRHIDVAETRAKLDSRWRDLLAHVVREGQFSGEVDASVDARRFALALAALLDGLSVQVGLNDKEVTPECAYELAMEFVCQQLGVSKPDYPVAQI